MGHSEIPQLQPITARPYDASDPVVLRHVYQERITELEEALLGMIGLVQLLAARGELTTDATKNHRFVTAIEVLR